MSMFSRYHLCESDVKQDQQQHEYVSWNMEWMYAVYMYTYMYYNP